MCHFLNCHIRGYFLLRVEYSKNEVIFTPMPLPEIHYSHAFGMGFWIAEDGTFMSCPAMDDANGRTTMDVENAIAVDEWDDYTVYSHHHMELLAQIVGICTLKRDYVRIGYYAERFRTVA